MNKPLALVVDDEPDIRELLAITLARMEVDARLAADIGEARDMLRRERFDLCLTDMRLPDGDGLDLVTHVGNNYPALPIAVITAHGNMEAAIQALKNGAFDFVTKPVDLTVLRGLVATALKLRERPETGRLGLIGAAPVMHDLRRKIDKLARSQAPVYITGESGTGKELVARLIHEQGPRAAQPFVPVNCGAIPDELIESELFGHRKGSFTGAVADKQGLFQAASGGTLFLDEVAELPLHLQVKLLRAIQEKKVRPVGAEAEIPVDVRLLSATHKDLGVLVAAGSFRQDLFYRINVIELQVPTLRDRRGDIALLTDHILGRIAAELGVPVPVLAPEAMEALQAYDFPGNVRELENILERAMALSEDERIQAEDLQLPREREAGAGRAESGLTDELDRVEREKIRAALEQTRWNRTRAARQLGITLRALRYRMHKLGLDAPD